MRAGALVLAVAGLLAAGVPVAGAAERNVSMRYNAYSPHHVVALTGETVKWTNKETSGPIPNHSVNPDDAEFPPSGPVIPGASFTNVFSTVDTVAYRCSFHPFMRGVVEVYELYLAGPPSSVLHGKTATLSGYAPEGSTVTIKREGVTITSAVAHSTTGRFTKAIPAVPGQYLAEADGRTSDLVRVNVKPKLTVTPRRKGKAFQITVSTKPNQTGAKMVLESRGPHGWKKLATRTLGATSKTVFKVVPKVKTQVRFRLTAPVGGYAKATSSTLTLRP